MKKRIFCLFMAIVMTASSGTAVLGHGYNDASAIRMTADGATDENHAAGAGGEADAGQPEDASGENHAGNNADGQPEELQETGNFGGAQGQGAENDDPSDRTSGQGSTGSSDGASDREGNETSGGTSGQGNAGTSGAGEQELPDAEQDRQDADDGKPEEDSSKTDDEVKGSIVNDADTPSDGSGENDDDSPVQGSIIADENNDDVVIKENDRPYLALGADLSDAQRATVLSIMGIDPAGLDGYDVVYVTNAEEHQYLDSYIASSQIGSRALSSVVIVKREKGSGLNISTTNITYCTVGMYKNALTTAGVKDADIIVAGPSGISGTAALVGIFKAYQEITGEVIEDSIVDVALHEIVVTGRLEESIEGLTDQEVEEFVAYIKSVIAEKDLTDEASINEVIDEACEKYGVTLSGEERGQIVDLLLKITSLGIDLDGLVDYAKTLYDSFKNSGGDSSGFFAKIMDAISDMFSSIGNFFRSLF